MPHINDIIIRNIIILVNNDNLRLLLISSVKLNILSLLSSYIIYCTNNNFILYKFHIPFYNIYSIFPEINLVKYIKI